MENNLTLKELLSHFNYPEFGSYVQMSRQSTGDKVLLPADYVLNSHWAESDEEVARWDFSFTANTLYIELKEAKE